MNALLEKLVTITVTFNPDIEQLKRQLQACSIANQIIIVDNDSNNIDEIQEITIQNKKIQLIKNEKNLGLAAALNIGAQAACQNNLIQYCLFLDQDSEPKPNSIEQLLINYQHLKNLGVRVGCVGPQLLDPTTHLFHGFHQLSGILWKRVFPKETDRAVSCTNLNGSGTLTSIELLKELQGFREDFFIDHIDTDWAFRVLHAGYTLWGIPQAIFSHSMGNKSFRFWFFGWKIWPYRTAQRHYFLFRNAILLMKEPYVPTRWKYLAALKLITTFLAHLLFDKERKIQCQKIIQGIEDSFSFSKQEKI